MERYFIPFLAALLLSISTVPVLIKISRRYGFIAEPREDRWHRRPTALLGGIAVFLSFLIPFLIFIPLNQVHWGLLICMAGIFFLGLYDDIREVRPATKFIIQTILATTVVLFGVRIMIIPYAIIAIPLTIFWIVAITNAINILDNMDGLSSGISFLSSVCILLYAAQNGSPLVALISCMVAGSALGFLIYNFHPAKIFMGNSGSLFLGFALSIVTIIGTWVEATNLLFTAIVPLSVMIIPIFDTTLVTFQRRTYGRPISQGGRDHSSHRLVFLGLSERKTVLYLMGISLAFGLTGVLLSRLNFYTTIIVLSIGAVCLLFFGIFLGQVRVYGAKKKQVHRTTNLVISSIILYKKQILQASVDLVLISAAYLSAYLLRYEGVLSDHNLALIETSLPILIFTKFAIFGLFGLYRGEWKYASVSDLIRIFKSVSLGSILLAVVLLLLYRFEGYSRAVFIIDYTLTLLLIGGVRILLRVFREYFFAASDIDGKIPVLIMGAGDGGELLMREIKNNPRINYRPIGFIDDDLEKKGKIIHGVEVLGSRGDMPAIVKANGVRKVFVSILSMEDGQLRSFDEICKNLKVECIRIRPIIEI
jgi:UDP-GlcNAc:undecaprenyl-phosphate GlcNAc-1-phosphate transferase